MPQRTVALSRGDARRGRRRRLHRRPAAVPVRGVPDHAPPRHLR